MERVLLLTRNVGLHETSPLRYLPGTPPALELPVQSAQFYLPQSMSLENLPCISPSAFSHTSSNGGPRRLLPACSSLAAVEKQCRKAFSTTTETAELPEILLIAGRDPGCRQRVQFNSAYTRLPFLDEAMGVTKEEMYEEETEEAAGEEGGRGEEKEEKGKGKGKGKGFA